MTRNKAILVKYVRITYKWTLEFFSFNKNIKELGSKGPRTTEWLMSLWAVATAHSESSSGPQWIMRTEAVSSSSESREPLL